MKNILYIIVLLILIICCSKYEEVDNTRTRSTDNDSNNTGITITADDSWADTIDYKQ